METKKKAKARKFLNDKKNVPSTNTKNLSEKKEFPPGSRSLMYLATIAGVVILWSAWQTRMQRNSTAPNINLEDVKERIDKITMKYGQCNIETVVAFAQAANSVPGLRYSANGGTLIGAFRNNPPGVMRWDHDSDMVMPAEDAFRFYKLFQENESWAWPLKLLPLEDCCYFGMRLIHTDYYPNGYENAIFDDHPTACFLDVFVLTYANYRYSLRQNPSFLSPFVSIPYYWWNWLTKPRQDMYVISHAWTGSPISSLDLWCAEDGKPLRACKLAHETAFYKELFTIDAFENMPSVEMYGVPVRVLSNSLDWLYSVFSKSVLSAVYIRELDGVFVDITKPNTEYFRQSVPYLKGDSK
eukprot:m.41752 g.41752  ORF g.41752 m.41752 type:complete len:355 (-) comp9807_c0_seq1:173-1237(-)